MYVEPRPFRDHRNALFFTALLWVALLLPGQSLDGLPSRFDHLMPEHLDKWIHFGLFWLESHFLYRSLRHARVLRTTLSDRRAIWITCALAITMAVLTEATQTLIPARAGRHLGYHGRCRWCFCLVAVYFRRAHTPPDVNKSSYNHSTEE